MGKPLTFNVLDDYVTDIANGIFGNISTKRKAKSDLLFLFVLACRYYQKDEKFRKELDAYATLYVDRR